MKISQKSQRLKNINKFYVNAKYHKDSRIILIKAKSDLIKLLNKINKEYLKTQKKVNNSIRNKRCSSRLLNIYQNDNINLRNLAQETFNYFQKVEKSLIGHSKLQDLNYYHGQYISKLRS